MKATRLSCWLVGTLAVPTALIAHASTAEGTFLALLVALSLAAVAVTERAAGVLVPVHVRPGRNTRAVVATPAQVARQCDPDAAGRPRPRAPGRAQD